MRRIRTSTILAFFVTFISLTFGCSVGRVQGEASDVDVLRFDAEWWQHAGSEEQQGFIYGYQDCRQPPKAAKASIIDYQNAVSEAVKSEKRNDPKVVTKAIEHSWTTLTSRDIRGGENYKGPHGFLDGEWWGEFTGTWPSGLASTDRGYLEGYLECSSTPVTNQAVHMYQAAINQHYASGLHSHDHVADVLQKLVKSRANSQK